jgi:membrane protease YdiL (CAAX protease family)
MTEEPTLDRRRIGSFLAIALGIAALVGGVIHATGGLDNSPDIVPGITLAAVLLATVYMFSPAVANVATRVLTGEGWTDLRIRPALQSRWQAYLAAWLGTSVLVGAGVGLYAVLWPARTAMPDLPVIAIVATVTVGPAINTLFAFGEEFGWRAYLLQKLTPLGVRRALLAHGVIWGVWHWPIIAMGYNYGLDYPAAPWTGLAMMTLATVAIGTVLGALALWADSVWPPALAHGTLNAVGSVAAVVGGGASLVSAAPVALVGVVPWAVVAVLVLARSNRDAVVWQFSGETEAGVP